MSAVLLDTHAWAWSFADSGKLTAAARAAIEAAEAVLVSPISFFEIGQKVRLGKWPEMEGHAGDLVEILRGQGGLSAPLGPDVCLSAALLNWSHRDPFDRLLAATAQAVAVPLISADTVFDDLPGISRVW